MDGGGDGDGGGGGGDTTRSFRAVRRRVLAETRAADAAIDGLRALVDAWVAAPRRCTPSPTTPAPCAWASAL